MPTSERSEAVVLLHKMFLLLVSGYLTPATERMAECRLRFSPPPLRRARITGSRVLTLGQPKRQGHSLRCRLTPVRLGRRRGRETPRSVHPVTPSTASRRLIAVTAIR